jgi:hypothetical protein
MREDRHASESGSVSNAIRNGPPRATKNCPPWFSCRCVSGRLWRSGLLQKTTAAFGTQTIAVATDGDDVAMVQQPVQNGCGDDGVAKNRAPLANVAIGGA